MKTYRLSILSYNIACVFSLLEMLSNTIKCDHMKITINRINYGMKEFFIDINLYTYQNENIKQIVSNYINSQYTEIAWSICKLIDNKQFNESGVIKNNECR